MDQWLIAEIHRRRDDLHARAAESRAIRRVKGAQGTTLRVRLANGADALSVKLANVAQAMREA